MGLEANIDGSNTIDLDDFCDFGLKPVPKVQRRVKEEDAVIEVLFPECCNLFGDISNIKYLQKCIPKAKFINTSFDQEPYFEDHHVDFIYMGSMTERMQERVIAKLLKHRGRIFDLILRGSVFLLTGNAFDVFCRYIENDQTERMPALDIFQLYVKKRMMKRHNSVFVGDYEGTKIVGFKSQFSYAFGDNSDEYFALTEKGIGINPTSKRDGMRLNNCMGTHLLGPLLILNPEFTAKLIDLIGIKDAKLAFEEDVKKAYDQRLKELMALEDEVYEN